MGTTQAALNLDGATIQVVVAIEGYEYLLTDGDAAAAVTAWSAHGWSLALSGLIIEPGMEQSITPWSAELDAPTLSFRVMDYDGADRFGIDTHRPKGGVETDLTAAALTASATSVAVESTTGFAGAGAIYVGTERIVYLGTSGGKTFTTCTRGTHAPFKADTESAQRFGRYHPVYEVDVAEDVAIPPHVADVPRNWIGKWVGVWIHTKEGGVLNSRADALCVFAGTISEVRDQSDGAALVTCEDVRGRLRDTVIMRRQYRGRLSGDMFLPAGFVISTEEVFSTRRASEFRVVASGASGAYQINEGYYSVDEIATAINAWFVQAKTDSQAHFNKSYGYTDAGGGNRARIVLSLTGLTLDCYINLRFSGTWGGAIAQRLGWDGNGPHTSYFGANPWIFDSQHAPWGSSLTYIGNTDYKIQVVDTRGSWVDQSTHMPVGGWTGTGWGFLLLSTGHTLLVQHLGADEFRVFDNALYPNSPKLAAEAIRDAVGGGQDVEVEQIMILGGTLTSVMTSILASTGTSGYNHATYDVFADHLGAAIPWEVLGTGWTQSIQGLDEANDVGSLLIIEKPTRLWDLFRADMMLRRATLLWRQEGLQAVSWSTPSSAAAQHTLTEANKATEAAAEDDNRSPSSTHDDWVVTDLGIKYARSLQANSYDAQITISDQGAVAETGISKKITIEAGNSLSVHDNVGIIGNLAAGAAAWLPLFSRPVRLVRRSVDQSSIATMTPGDTALVTDSFVRDPVTGARGISQRPCLIVGHRWRIAEGAFVGEVDLLVEPMDRLALYSPAAQVDHTVGTGGFTAGYKISPPTLRCVAHQHSESSESPDAANFAASDKILIYSIDGGGSSTSWTREVASVSGSDIVLTSALSSPAFDSTLRYRIVSDTYSAAATNQRAEAYLASSSTHLVASSIRPYRYGYATNAPSVWSAGNATGLVNLGGLHELGDGSPLSVGAEQDLAQVINNLNEGRTAIHGGQLLDTTLTTGHITARAVIYVQPIYVGSHEFPMSATRLLAVRPFARNNHLTATRKIYVTLAKYPPFGNALEQDPANGNNYVLVQPYITKEWTLGAASAWAALSAQTMTIKICEPTLGWGWLIVEADTNNIEFRGFALRKVGLVQ